MLLLVLLAALVDRTGRFSGRDLPALHGAAASSGGEGETGEPLPKEYAVHFGDDWSSYTGQRFNSGGAPAATAVP